MFDKALHYIPSAQTKHYYAAKQTYPCSWQKRNKTKKQKEKGKHATVQNIEQKKEFFGQNEVSATKIERKSYCINADRKWKKQDF